MRRTGFILLSIVILLIVMNPNPVSANPIQKISRDSTNQEISGLSLSGDLTQGGRCTESQRIGRTCLEFETPNPKVVTINSEEDRSWSIWNDQKGVSEFLQVGQMFLSNIDGRKSASAKVQALSSRSLTLEITPLIATDSALTIGIGTTSIYILIIVNQNATPRIALNCPQSVTTFEKDPLVVKIQSNIPVEWQDYMNYGQTSWGWDRELNSIDVSVSPDKTLLQLVVKPKIVSSSQETIRLTASSILNNPYPVGLPKVICDIQIKNSSKGRVPVYKAFWRDGSQSTARQFTADKLTSAYIVVQFAEKNSKGEILKKTEFSQESRRINVDVWGSDRQWTRLFDRALNADFEVAFNVPADIFNCRDKCGNRTERFRLSSDDNSFVKEFQVKLTKGFFDFAIQIPAQVEWGKKYKASIKANRSINGICSFYSFYRGNIFQGSSRMTNGAASRFVEFYWGDVKSTTVQLEVICKSKGFTVSNIAYVKAFRK